MNFVFLWRFLFPFFDAVASSAATTAADDAAALLSCSVLFLLSDDCFGSSFASVL